MSRRLRIATRELGPLEVFVVYSKGGQWEQEWAALQGDPIVSLFTEVTLETYTHALNGWTKPLITALGLNPKAALVKVPDNAKHCYRQAQCPFYDPKTCFPTTKKLLPWCYEADVSETEAEKRFLASEVIRYWREGVYVLVVAEP